MPSSLFRNTAGDRVSGFAFAFVACYHDPAAIFHFDQRFQKGHPVDVAGSQGRLVGQRRLVPDRRASVAWTWAISPFSSRVAA
jgi:hypothetical protein